MAARSLSICAALVFAFIGAGLWISSAASTTERALVWALILFVATSALQDVLLITTLLRTSLPPQVVFGLAALNPSEAARVGILTSVDPELSVLGPVGFWLANTLGLSTPCSWRSLGPLPSEWSASCWRWSDCVASTSSLERVERRPALELATIHAYDSRLVNRNVARVPDGGLDGGFHVLGSRCGGQGCARSHSAQSRRRSRSSRGAARSGAGRWRRSRAAPGSRRRASVAEAMWNISVVTSFASAMASAQAHAGKMKTLLACPMTWCLPACSTSAKGLPVRDDGATAVQRIASSAVHSALLVGLLSGITIGRSTSRAMVSSISSVNVPACAVAPMRMVGFDRANHVHERELGVGIEPILGHHRARQRELRLVGLVHGRPSWSKPLAVEGEERRGESWLRRRPRRASRWRTAARCRCTPRRRRRRRRAARPCAAW